MRISCQLIICLLGSLLLVSPSTGAENTRTEVREELLPLWELGVMGLGARLPHYPGSDEYRSYLFPLPYFVYRGKVVRANRDGLRTIFYRSGGFETSLSFFGNPPVPDSNEAREGMGGLDAVGEAGPALRYFFYEYGERDSLYLQANLRGAVSADFDQFIDLRWRGVRGELSVILRNNRWLARYNSRVSFNTGISFADSDLNNYFYEVGEKDSTAARPEYHSSGGYGGAHIATSLVTEITPSFWLGGYLRLNNLSGAVFADSPLVKQENNWVMGAMLIWVISRSETLVL